MRSTAHTGVMLDADPLGLYVDCAGPMVIDRRIDVQELHRALGEYLAETKCARCDGTGMLDDLIDRQAPCPDCAPDSDVINGVPRELLQDAALMLEAHSPGGGSLESYAAEDIRALLTAQPQASAAQSAPAGEREAFEAWWVSRPHRKVPSKYENGDYVAPSVHSAWEVWQARASWQRTQSAGAPDGLTFNALRAANTERIGSSKYRQCEENWTPAHWMQATVGELGELANLLKKVDRGDFPFEQVKAEVGKELADVQTYLDILALKLGVDLGQATVDKFNEVSERIGSPVRLAAAPAQPAAQDQGEVQRLREALDGLYRHITARDLITRGELSRRLDAAAAALAASTGQEV